MTTLRNYLPLSLVFLLGLGALFCASGVSAEETPKDATPSVALRDAALRPPNLTIGALDLLPLSDLERDAFIKEHGPLVYRTQALNRQVQRTDGKIRKLSAALKDKKVDKARRKKLAAQRKQAQDERRRLRLQQTALIARLTNELIEDGMPPALIPVMNAAPQGKGRVERHSRSLVLMLPELTADQWDLFRGVFHSTEGALHAISAQRERTVLALKQTDLTKPQVQSVTATFDQQLRLIDKRYWQLVDFTLDRAQRVALWKMLPQRMKRKAQAKEHLYALPDLTPGQSSRLRALVTELEQEAAPDGAAVKRLGVALRKKGLEASERKALTQERNEANKRLSELRRFSVTELRKVLSEDQYLEFLAIPPRLSINDRSASNRRILQDFKPSAEQQAAIKTIANEVRTQRRAASKKLADLRRKSGDYGPDSPQMMSMMMQMAGVKSDGTRVQREVMGRVFLHVLTRDQVSQWVLGHWGYKR